MSSSGSLTIAFGHLHCAIRRLKKARHSTLSGVARKKGTRNVAYGGDQVNRVMRREPPRCDSLARDQGLGKQAAPLQFFFQPVKIPAVAAVLEGKWPSTKALKFPNWWVRLAMRLWNLSSQPERSIVGIT